MRIRSSTPILRSLAGSIRLLLAPLLIIGFAADRAAAGCSGSECWDLGLYGDAACGSCNIDIGIGESKDIYVVVRNHSEMGILQAEFRVVGLPVGWQAVATPNPAANVALGNPFGNGANIAFVEPQEDECSWLYRVNVTATSVVHDVTLSIVQHATPSNPQFACPRINCDCSPAFPVICVPGGTMSINGEDCVVSTAERPWSTMKSLYKH